MPHNSKLKQKIVDYINEYIRNEDEEQYLLTDIFYTSGDNNGKLQFCGFRLLKKLYDFHEVEFSINESPLDYNTLVYNIQGFYYLYKKNASHKTLRMQTTDNKFVNKMKICNYDFDIFKETYANKKSTYRC